MNVTRSRLQADNARQSYDLLAKKEKLFIIKDPAQWELDEDKARKVPREQLLEDKDLAFELMLSRVKTFGILWKY